MKTGIGSAIRCRFSDLDPGDVFIVEGMEHTFFIKVETYAVTGNVLDWANKEINAISLQRGTGIWIEGNEQVTWWSDARVSP